MRKLAYFFATIILLSGLSACKKKQDTTIIISRDSTEVKPMETIALKPYSQTYPPVEWLDRKFTVSVDFKADKSLPKVMDGEQEYYDNRIHVTIKREDGSKFFDRDFTKADFARYLDGDFKKNGALLGVAFDKVDGNTLLFAASVGSPDELSDEYVPFCLKVTKAGGVSISKDTQLDTASDVEQQTPANENEPSDDDGV